MLMRRYLSAGVTLSCLAIAGVNSGYKITAAENLNYSHRSIQPPVIHADSAYGLLTFPANQGALELAGTSWQLVKFQGGDETTLTPKDKSKYTISFGKEGRVSAQIDCNRGSGNWRSSGPNQLQIGLMTFTRAMCPPGSLHDRIARDLKFVTSYTIKDGHLFLSLLADGGIYEFESMGGSQSSDSTSPVTESLFGKRWRLTWVKGAAVSTTKPYIEFDPQSKRFSGDGGCNSIAGGFEVDGMRIRFSQSISTKRACIESEIQQVETDFLQGLEEATEFKLQGDLLHLYAGDRPLLTFRSASTGTNGSVQTAQVSGTVTYRQRIALTPNAVIEVKLLDVSRADAPAVTIAEQMIKPAGRQVPIAFALDYDPGRIDDRGRYIIQARILESGQVRFINTQPYPVITIGSPKTVNVIVSPVRH
jgi:uncharacterized lipoprotein YbaY/heat shock protein HslJ